MPNSNSAAKRVRQNEKARTQNKARKTELKTLRRRLERAVHDGKKDEAEELYRRFTKRIDQAAGKGVLHRNTAARRKARLGHALAVGPVAAPAKASRKTKKTEGAQQDS